MSHYTAVFYHCHSEGVLGIGKFRCWPQPFSYSWRPNAFVFVISSNVRRPLVAGAFANNLTSHFLRLPTTCIRVMVENTLSLGDRVKLIDYAKKNPGVGTRRIAEIFKCGRTQVQAILKVKESIIADFETNAPALRKRSCGTRYQYFDDAVHEWYSLARQQLVPVSGPMLQSEALLLAKELGNKSFKASNGWLQSFKQRHNIIQLVVSGGVR